MNGACTQHGKNLDKRVRQRNEEQVEKMNNEIQLWIVCGVS